MRSMTDTDRNLIKERVRRKRIWKNSDIEKLSMEMGIWERQVELAVRNFQIQAGIDCGYQPECFGCKNIGYLFECSRCNRMVKTEDRFKGDPDWTM